MVAATAPRPSLAIAAELFTKVRKGDPARNPSYDSSNVHHTIGGSFVAKAQVHSMAPPTFFVVEE